MCFTVVVTQLFCSLTSVLQYIYFKIIYTISTHWAFVSCCVAHLRYVGHKTKKFKNHVFRKYFLFFYYIRFFSSFALPLLDRTVLRHGICRGTEIADDMQEEVQLTTSCSERLHSLSDLQLFLVVGSAAQQVGTSSVRLRSCDPCDTCSVNSAWSPWKALWFVPYVVLLNDEILCIYLNFIKQSSCILMYSSHCFCQPKGTKTMFDRRVGGFDFSPHFFLFVPFYRGLIFVFGGLISVVFLGFRVHRVACVIIWSNLCRGTRCCDPPRAAEQLSHL